MPNTSVLSQTPACTAQTVDGKDMVGTWWYRYHRGPQTFMRRRGFVLQYYLSLIMYIASLPVP